MELQQLWLREVHHPTPTIGLLREAVLQAQQDLQMEFTGVQLQMQMAASIRVR